jgi:superfamily II DNA or RNA helicase
LASFIGIERLTLGPWQALERSIHRLFMHAGFDDCRLVGGSGDQGCDILASKNNRLYVTQVKYRRAAIGIDPSVIKEIIHAIGAYSANEAIIATNQYFQTDTYKLAEKYSSELNVPIRLWPGEKLLEWSKKLPEYPVSVPMIRSYQDTALQLIDAARSQGKKQGLIIMATGLGKTRIASELISRELMARPQFEILILAHTVELVKQFEKALWEVLPKDVITHIWAGGEYPSFFGGVICGTMQSVIQAAKKENLTNRFSLVIVDEAHHAPAEGYSELIHLLKPNFLLGMTATPWRSDEKILSDMFGLPVFTMGIIEGMQQGYLSKVDYRMLVDDIDWDEVKELSKQKLTVSELNRKLFVPQRDEAMVSKIIEHFDIIEKPRCIIFCRTIKHAESINKLLRALGKPSKVIHSALDRIEATNVLRNFRSGMVPILISVDMLNEGIDVPDVNLVVFLRVTHSRRIFVQQLGRGLRLREGKTTVKVLDFVADIRRIAAGMRINKEVNEYSRSFNQNEAVRFAEGRLVNFSNDKALSLFNEYLQDIAQVEDLDDNAKLRFPPIYINDENT